MPADETSPDRRLADDFRRLVAEGRLAAGERLPSLRELARRYGCSVGSALRGYQRLEAEGLIESRTRSGYFVKAEGAPVPGPGPVPRHLRPDAADPVRLALRWRLSLAQEDPATISFSGGSPTLELLPLASLAKMGTRLLREMPELLGLMDIGPGSIGLRRALAHAAAQEGWRLEADELVATNGAVEAVGLCLRAVTAPGDAVAVEAPLGVLHPVLAACGLRPIELRADPERGVDPAALERAIVEGGAKACLLQASFQNPLGFSLPEGRKREIVRLLARLETPLVECDANADLGYDGVRPVPFKAFDEQGLVLWCASPSKLAGPGLRLGWCAPGRYLDAVLRLKLGASRSASPLAQELWRAFLEEGEARRQARALQETLGTSARALRRIVRESFPPGTRVGPAHGGCYLWVELPPDHDTGKLLERSLAANIAFMPGAMLTVGLDLSRGLRLNHAQPWGPVQEAAARRLGELAHGPRA